jgi:hypothetical protein
MLGLSSYIEISISLSKAVESLMDALGIFLIARQGP